MSLARMWVDTQSAAVRADAIGAGGGLLRVPVMVIAPAAYAHERASMAASPRGVKARTPPPPPDAPAPSSVFCFHRDTAASPAGAVCRDCGTVVVDAACPGTERGRQPPVMARTALPEGVGPSRAEEACRNEWNLHTASLTDQPEEVLQGARGIFEEVYLRHGVITGAKAQALVRVALLYCGRRLHGADRANEERLIRRFPVSAQLLNRAFTQMAAAQLSAKRRADA